MRCKQIKSLLTDYAAGCLERAQAAEISRHLETCAECRREAGQAKEIYALLKADQIPAPPEDFWPELTRQTLSRIQQPSPHWWDKISLCLHQRNMAYGLGLAGCAALIAMIYLSSLKPVTGKLIPGSGSGATNVEYIFEDYSYPGTSGELLYQLGSQELDEVSHNLNAGATPAAGEFVAKRNGIYDLLYQLNGRQLDYLEGQLQELTQSKPEDGNEIS